MASYLRPRRGKKATAESQNIVLKKGEIFFEVPTGGVGKGIGKLKMGDGTTAYKNLPYFLEQRAATDVANSTIAFTATSETNNTTLLNKIANNAKLNVIIPAIKNLLSNLNNSVTQLNNDLDELSTKLEKLRTGQETFKEINIQNKVILFADIEGGNIRIVSPNNIVWELDTTDESFRIMNRNDYINGYGIIIDRNGVNKF